ncbi:MAG: hypothetical protein IKG82_08030 [Oscillospiraceae bacterium]|nr:hypothetical protein [Oscillospiraceae bacterium]
MPIFKQICTECIKEKIAAQPETLGNFKVLYSAQEPVVTSEEIPASYEDILEMDTEAASVSGTETYADNTQYYGIPDDEIESRNMGEAIRQREEDADEETEIPAAVIDEDGESVWEPEPEDIADVHYYDTPDDIPAKLEDLAGEELEVQLRSVEIYSNNTEKSGDPDDLTGFSFDLMT